MRNAGSLGHRPRRAEDRGGGQEAPFGTDLIFAAEDLDDFIFHVEICEDYWAPQPPSTVGALAGALILCNLSASNITIGKADERKCSAPRSPRCCAAYVYSAAGPGESTTDLAWDGQGSIYELGELLAETGRFDMEPELASPTSTSSAAARADAHADLQRQCRAPPAIPRRSFRRIGFEHQPSFADIGFERPLRRFPYVPQPARAARSGLLRGVQHPGPGPRQALPGDQTGQASRHRRLGRARFDPRPDRRRQGLRHARPAALDDPRLHHARLRHLRHDQVNAWALMKALGVTARRSTSSRPRCRCSKDMGHPFAKGEPVYDVTFENVQAGLRTDYLFRLANQRSGFVSAPATCPSSRSAGAPTASATR
jgi:NAD+ synthase (glutamine-hydrolysing)